MSVYSYYVVTFLYFSAICSSAPTVHRIYEHHVNIKNSANVTAGCQFGNEHFNEGQYIPRSNDDCEKCFCVEREVICWNVRCPFKLQSENCKQFQIDGVCCPAYECPSTENESKNVSATIANEMNELLINSDVMENNTEIERKEECRFGDSYYPVGSAVESISQPCLQCKCNLNNQNENECKWIQIGTNCGTSILMDDNTAEETDTLETHVKHFQSIAVLIQNKTEYFFYLKH